MRLIVLHACAISNRCFFFFECGYIRIHFDLEFESNLILLRIRVLFNCMSIRCRIRFDVVYVAMSIIFRVDVRSAYVLVYIKTLTYSIFVRFRFESILPTWSFLIESCAVMIMSFVSESNPIRIKFDVEQKPKRFVYKFRCLFTCMAILLRFRICVVLVAISIRCRLESCSACAIASI